VQLIEKVNSPWLHSNPDFCNTLATGREEYAYKGIAAMFRHAYGIYHVKDREPTKRERYFVSTWLERSASSSAPTIAATAPWNLTLRVTPTQELLR
jgi:hypothetical protein